MKCNTEDVIKYIKHHKLDEIKQCIENGFDVKSDNNKVVQFAAVYGWFDIFKYIMLNTDVDISDGEIIKSFLYFSVPYDYHNDVTNLIIKLINDKRIKPSTNESAMFNWAISRNKIDLVKLCLKDPDVDANVSNGGSIFTAVKYNHHQILDILIQNEKINFDKFNSELFRSAVNYNADDCVYLLMKIPQIKNYDYYASVIRDMLHKTISHTYNFYIAKQLLDLVKNDLFFTSLALKFAIAHKRVELIEHIVRYRKIDYTHTDIFFDYAANIESKQYKPQIIKILVHHKNFLKHLSLTLIKNYKCIAEEYANFMNITTDEFILLTSL